VVDLIAVQTKDPFKILVATILSARTKDETTAKAAARLFKKAPNLKKLAMLPESDIAKLIYPVGFYKNKASYLTKLPNALQTLYDGVIPSDVEELTKLPGVGRKTANLVVAIAFHKPAICVDTHVHRISNRLGWVKTTDPEKTEQELLKIVPKSHWKIVNDVLVGHGKTICAPISPKCSECAIRKLCKRVGVTKSR